MLRGEGETEGRKIWIKKIGAKKMIQNKLMRKKNVGEKNLERKNLEGEKLVDGCEIPAEHLTSARLCGKFETKKGVDNSAPGLVLSDPY